MKVNFKHRDYVDHSEQWLKVRDCIGGKDRILKSLNLDNYLPNPGESDIDPGRVDRYRKGAVFYNYTGRTLDGLVGAMYLSDPQIELPLQLKGMIEDADGTGRSLTIYSKNISRENASIGRGAILAEYPRVQAGGKEKREITIKDMKDNNLKPTLAFYAAENILNWKMVKVGGKFVLSYIVLREFVDIEVDGNKFNRKQVEHYRILELEKGRYKQSVYKATENLEDQELVEDEIYPTTHNGLYFNYIPLVFVGSQDLSASVDKPPLIDIANVNLAHYRNSADLEEMSFNAGQATAVVVGSEQSPLDEKDQPVKIGSRALVKVPMGGDFKFAQVQETNVHMKMMEDKKKSMAEIGANIITEKADAEAQETVKTKESTRLVSLSDIAKNTSEAIERALRYACDFVGANPDDVIFKLDQSFSRLLLTFDHSRQVAELWLMGAISQDIMLSKLREMGLIPEDIANEEVIRQIAGRDRDLFQEDDKEEVAEEEEDAAKAA